MRITALSIAGLDPSGGAGILADARGFRAAGVWPACVCAALTVQSTRGVEAVVPVEPSLVEAQARAVLADAKVRAMKTGALGSTANAGVVETLAREHPRVALVVDPVMMPTKGAARLDGTDGVRAMRSLARAATLVTPNIMEAAALLGEPITGENGAKDAAIALVEAGSRAALVKGGDAKGPEAVDWLATPGGVVRIARPRRRVGAVHGTGCALASLIAGRLAATLGRSAPADAEIASAVRWARARVDAALERPLAVGHGMRVLAVGVA